jgi:hypothetical protein
MTLWPAPDVSTADDAVTAETPAPTNVHCSRLFTCGVADGDCDAVGLTVSEDDVDGVTVSDRVCEVEPVIVPVGDSVAEDVRDGATADAFTTKTKLDSVRFHAAPPAALVDDAMTSKGAVYKVSRGAEMGPSVAVVTLKAPDDAVVPLHAIVAVSSPVGAEYESVSVTFTDVNADAAPYENKLPPAPGADVDGCAWYRPPLRPAKADCASKTYTPDDDMPKPPADPKLGAAVESAT